jgi:predicted ATP-grasp superfamily ATP-dependent carboligase
VQQQAILIVAQSGRFLAQIAHRAGYPVWVADCFGDNDTLEVASRWLPITNLSNPLSVLDTVLALSNGEACTLVYGSGIESFHGILGQLPNRIKLVGNSQHTIETVKNPSQFFNTLDQLAIAYPMTQLHPPQETIGWLSKSPNGLGGGHIEYCQAEIQRADVYYQRYVNGISGSVLFLANGADSQLLSINQQFSVNAPEIPFLLSGLGTPFHLSDVHQNMLQSMIDALLSQLDLYGLNSLDFIITDADEILVLEINPRPSASAELLTQLPQLFNLHIDACQGRLLIDTVSRPKTNPTYLHYIFAQHNTVIPNNIIWPSMCHDIPAAGHLILNKEPICTVLIVETPLTFDQSREQVQNDIYALLGCA